MRIAFHSKSHLGAALAAAARLRGFEILLGIFARDQFADMHFVCQDVPDHADLLEARAYFDGALDCAKDRGEPVILVSQVPPGTTREWARGRENVFYQADTLIMRNALQRAYAPEQFIVGAADPGALLPLAYQEYLMAHECPVRVMSYESAELAKSAINYHLAVQVRTANELARIAEYVGADYDAVAAALRADARVGAYLRPGSTNQHLDRDVETILRILGELGSTSSWMGG